MGNWIAREKKKEEVCIKCRRNGLRRKCRGIRTTALSRKSAHGCAKHKRYYPPMRRAQNKQRQKQAGQLDCHGKGDRGCLHRMQTKWAEMEIPEDPDRYAEPEQKEKAANGIRLYYQEREEARA